jgi:hypothetical protein
VLVPCAHDADDHDSARPASVIITARYFFIFTPAFAPLLSTLAAEFDDLGADKRRMFGRQERGRQVPAIVAASAAMRVVQDP